MPQLLWKTSLPALLTYSVYLTYYLGSFPRPAIPAGNVDAVVAVVPAAPLPAVSPADVQAPDASVAVGQGVDAQVADVQEPTADESAAGSEAATIAQPLKDRFAHLSGDLYDVIGPEQSPKKQQWLPDPPAKKPLPPAEEHKRSESEEELNEGQDEEVEQEQQRGRKRQQKPHQRQEKKSKDGEAGDDTWHYCAKQWEECVCPGTLRWGNGDTWLKKKRKKGEKEIKVSCSIMQFKDILPGDDAKHCECSEIPTNKAALAQATWKEVGAHESEAAVVPGRIEWVFCASQWQECACPGRVRWGNAGKWMYLAPKKGYTEVVVKCSIDFLADVAPGDEAKHCDCLVDSSSEFFEQINPGFLELAGLGHLRKTGNDEITSCAILESVADLSPPDTQAWKAAEYLCNEKFPWDAVDGNARPEAGEKSLDQATMRRLMQTWVHPRFKESYRRLYKDSGWLPRAFVNYYAGAPTGKIVNMTEELVRSVHEFSEEAIVVMHFGFATPERWTPEEFPRLVVLHAAPMPPTALRSFNFNKLRAMMLSRVIVGIELDSDQWVAPGVDTMFARTQQEVTEEYPMPILPSHFLDWGPSGEGPGGIGAKLWDRYCPEGKEGKCRWQTQRWGHAHPTWTFWAVPFLGRWLRRNFRDETLPAADGKQALQVREVLEDEDLLNVATWEEQGTKQWCKFDLPDPSEFETVFLHVKKGSSRRTCTKGDMCDDIGADGRWHPNGVAKMFFTAHHAVNPNETRLYLRRMKVIADTRRQELPPPILYHHRFFKDGDDLRSVHPDLTCLV